MTEVQKIRKMIDALDRLETEYRSTGNFTYANKINSVVMDLPNSSMARLYDILQEV